MSDDVRSHIRELAQASLREGSVTAWFERLYKDAGGDFSRIPWADLAPNAHLVSWLEKIRLEGTSLGGTLPNGELPRALVVGCGLGDDAAAIAARGFNVTAFDISETAIAVCKERFLNSHLDYLAADLLRPPAEWHHAFDFVFEAYTLQALPYGSREREKGLRHVAALVGEGGALLVIARGRESSDPEGELPWPMTHEELQKFEALGLRAVTFEDFMDGDIRRFRAHYERSGNAAARRN